MEDMMKEKPLRIYVDSSVVLGMFDKDEMRRKETTTFWDAVKSRDVVVVISDVLDAETEQSRDLVLAFLDSLPESQIMRV
jgi:hypothetical protein